MSFSILALVLWGGAAVLAFLVVHRAALRALWNEPVLAQPVLIVESDDWGPGPVADADALAGLASRLAAVRDQRGRPAVMTLGVVCSLPDGAAMLADGLARYHRRALDAPEFAPMVEAMRAGCGAGVFALQRHGMEHFWPAALLARARVDASLRDWLADPQARSEGLPSHLQSRWIDASVLPSRPLDPAAVQCAVDEEARLLERLFGAAPVVAVPNTFVWDDAVERAWAGSGVRCIVTPGRRIEGRDGQGALMPPTRVIRNGERTAGGLMQLVRDDYFEPIRGHRAEQVWQAVAAKRRLGRPVLLETHRESFVGATAVARAAIDELERALRGVLERHPDVRFLSTAELADELAAAATGLVTGSLPHRVAVFLTRVEHEPALRRFLKYSGLRFALAPVFLIAGVMHGRCAARAR